MGELFPIATGVLIGGLLGTIAPRLRLPAALTLALVFGMLATVLSGEYQLTWGYLLVDIPLVGVSSAAAYLAVGVLRRRSLPAS